MCKLYLVGAQPVLGVAGNLWPEQGLKQELEQAVAAWEVEAEKVAG